MAHGGSFGDMQYYQFNSSLIIVFLYNIEQNYMKSFENIMRLTEFVEAKWK